MASPFRRFSISRRGGAFAALFLALAIAAADAGQDGIKIMRLFGAVEFQRSGASSWSRATERLVLRTGDRLRTRNNAWCYLELHEGNIVKVLANSSVKLESVSQSSERVTGRILFAYRGVGAYNVYLENGQVYPVLERFSGSSMNLSTPCAVAGVRGTIFEANVERVDGGQDSNGGAEPGGTYNVSFAVHKGSIDVTDLSNPNAGATSIPAGFALNLRNVRVPSGGFGAPGQRPQGGQPGGQGPGGQRPGQPGQAGQPQGGQQPGSQPQGQPGGDRPGQPGGQLQGARPEGQQGAQPQGTAPRQGGATVQPQGAAQPQGGATMQPQSATQPQGGATMQPQSATQPQGGVTGQPSTGAAGMQRVGTATPTGMAGAATAPAPMPSGPLAGQVQPIGSMQIMRPGGQQGGKPGQANQPGSQQRPGQPGMSNQRAPVNPMPIVNPLPGTNPPPLYRPPPPEGTTTTSNTSGVSH